MKKIVAVFLLSILGTLCLCTIIPAKASDDQGSWVTKASLPTARTGFGIAVVNGTIFAMGGHIPSGAHSDIIEQYDPSTNEWVSRNKMPQELAYFGSAVLENKIYVIGGAWGPLFGMGVDSVFIYDPATDDWTTGTSMPTARVGIQANVVDGKIYVIGGTLNTQAPFSDGKANEITNVNEVYDAHTDTWFTKAAIPTPVSHYASAVVGDKIYVIGGFTQVANSTSVYGATVSVATNQIYDTKTDTWTMGAPLSEAVNANGGATTGTMAPKRVYVIGEGLNQIYNLATNSWSTGAPMPNAADRLTNFDDVEIAVLNDRLYAIGGVYKGEGNAFYSVNVEYTPADYGSQDGSASLTSTPETYVGNLSLTVLVIATVLSVAVVSLLILFFAKRRSNKEMPKRN